MFRRYNGRHVMIRAVRTLSVQARIGIAAVALAGAAAVYVAAAPAQPASAWAWDPHVTVSGSLTGCGWGAQTAYVRGRLNGELQTQNTGLGQPPSYSVTFDNVPTGYSWAWFVVHCNGGQVPDYGVWVHMYRPTVGTTLHVNL